MHERELLAIVHALGVFRCYCKRRPVAIKTDHNALKWIMTQKNLSQRQARWQEKLADFTFTVDYVPGKENIVADALSRRPDLQLAALFKGKGTAPVPSFRLLLAASLLQSGIFSPMLLDADVRRHIILGYPADAALTAQVERHPKDFERSADGALYYVRDRVYRLCVPRQPELIQLLLEEHHDAHIGGHLGVIKTLESVKRYFWWNGMDDSVRDYIGSCPSCQKNKATTQRPMGLLQPLPIPEKRWDSVSLDFTFGLPVTPDGYDGIVVFVDRLSKMVHCAPCKNTITGAETAQLYLRTVFKYHGVCKELVSDRDPRVTGQFWQTCFRALGTKLNMSTARHPQTDGQTERMIRTLKEMLRSFVSEQKDNWAEMLPYVEFASNDSVQASTGHTPFFLGAGDHPNRPTSLLSHADTARAPAALDLLAELKSTLAQAREHIKAAQQRQEQDANRFRRDATFKVGDKVLISKDNVRLPAGPARTLTPNMTAL